MAAAVRTDWYTSEVGDFRTKNEMFMDDAEKSILTVDTNKAVIEKQRSQITRVRLTMLAPLILFIANMERLKTKVKNFKNKKNIHVEVEKQSFWTKFFNALHPTINRKTKEARRLKHYTSTMNMSDNTLWSKSSYQSYPTINNRKSSKSSSRVGRVKRMLSKRTLSDPVQFDICDEQGEELFPVNLIFEEVRRRNNEAARERAESEQYEIWEDDMEIEQGSKLSDGSVDSMWNPVPIL